MTKVFLLQYTMYCSKTPGGSISIFLPNFVLNFLFVMKKHLVCSSSPTFLTGFTGGLAEKWLVVVLRYFQYRHMTPVLTNDCETMILMLQFERVCYRELLLMSHHCYLHCQWKKNMFYSCVCENTHFLNQVFFTWKEIKHFLWRWTRFLSWMLVQTEHTHHILH